MRPSHSSKYNVSHQFNFAFTNPQVLISSYIRNIRPQNTSLHHCLANLHEKDNCNMLIKCYIWLFSLGIWFGNSKTVHHPLLSSRSMPVHMFYKKYIFSLSSFMQLLCLIVESNSDWYRSNELYGFHYISQ